MARRRRLRPAAVLLAAMALCWVAACSGDDDPSTAATTSTVAPDGATSSVPDDTTTTTLSDLAYLAQVDRAQQAVTAAGDDECRLLAVGGTLSDLPAPRTAVQARRSIEVILQYLRAVADSVDDRPVSVAKLRDAAFAIESDAASADYDPTVLNAENGLAAFRSRNYREAMADLNQHAEARCTTTSTTRG